jgi:hypothetical protein
MFQYRLPKRLVTGQARLPECLYVASDEPLPLLVGDLQIAVDIDDVLKCSYRDSMRTSAGRQPA